MMRLSFERQADRPLSVLALGAHADDIEIGCGGTLLELIARDLPLDVTWVVLGATGERAVEAEQSAETFLEGAPQRRVLVESFEDSFFPYYGAEVKRLFERLKGDVDPDVVFTHTRVDLHQDHRLVCELTWNTFREHLVLEYEVPKYDGDLGAPNVFVTLTEATAQRKLELLLSLFPSQAGKSWFREDVFRGLLALRAMESRSASGFAEAFYGRKLAF
jgi:LmbE family N-acetylglucosaminyl deacetylase